MSFIGPYLNLYTQGADKRLGSVHRTKLEGLTRSEVCLCMSVTECIFEEALHPWHTEKFLKWDSKEFVGVLPPLEYVYREKKPSYSLHRLSSRHNAALTYFLLQTSLLYVNTSGNQCLTKLYCLSALLLWHPAELIGLLSWPFGETSKRYPPLG